jgi:hypothetical protein
MGWVSDVYAASMMYTHHIAWFRIAQVRARAIRGRLLIPPHSDFIARARNVHASTATLKGGSARGSIQLSPIAYGVASLSAPIRRSRRGVGMMTSDEECVACTWNKGAARRSFRRMRAERPRTEIHPE